MKRLGTIKANIVAKTSQKDGSTYKQVALSQAVKQQDGSYADSTLWLFASDVANVIAVLTATLSELTEHVKKDTTSGAAYQDAKNNPPATQFDDEIPF